MPSNTCWDIVFLLSGERGYTRRREFHHEGDEKQLSGKPHDHLGGVLEREGQSFRYTLQYEISYNLVSSYSMEGRPSSP